MQTENKTTKYTKPVFQVEEGNRASHRVLEISGLVVFACLFVLLAVKTVVSLFDRADEISIPLAVLTPFLAYLAADFIGGFVHFLCDNFGSPATPWFGPNFIRPFRAHHDDPQGIVRHDFVEVNGNTCLASVPMLMGVYHFWPNEYSIIVPHFALFIIFFALFVVLTNQFHKWAHQAKPPAIIRKLQSMNMILPAHHHGLHHRTPFDRYYCITSGWLNPLLTKIRFFEICTKLISQLTNLKNANRQ